MITIKTDLVVTQDGKAFVELLMPPEALPCVHHATVIIDERSVAASLTVKLPLRLPAYCAPLVNNDFSFRREDLYGDNGR
jgi:hypothetical protein